MTVKKIMHLKLQQSKLLKNLAQQTEHQFFIIIKICHFVFDITGMHFFKLIFINIAAIPITLLSNI